MKMIVGLGNIGPQYTKSRHNTGFMTVEAFANEHGILLNNRKMEAKFGIGVVDGHKVIVVEPTTFMNESGRAVHPLMEYYDVAVEDVIIVHDDMDLPLGKIRFRDKGSAGGHNGIKSIIEHLGTKEFARLKVGIEHPKQVSVVDYVLGKFTADQTPLLNQAIDKAEAGLLDWVNGMSIRDLENKYN